MAWKDLQSELAEMFGDLSSRSDEVQAAMDRRNAWRRSRHRRAWIPPAKRKQMRKYNREWMTQWRQNPENRERQRQSQRESRARASSRRREAGLPVTTETDRQRSGQWAKDNPERMRELRKAWKQKKRQDPEYRAEVNRKERERRAKCSS